MEETPSIAETPPEASTEPAGIHYGGEEEPSSSIPVYTPDQPLPASALDGYVLDEHEVLEAIVQVDTGSVEQESQVLEAVEAISTSHAAEDDLLEDGPDTPATPLPSAPKPMSAYPAAPPAAAPSKNSNIKHGFF